MPKKGKNTGICLQACLKRTENDLKSLLEENAAIRLVKGFYSNYNIPRWNDVTKNYLKLMKILLLKCPKPAVATHDLELIDEAKKLIKKYNLKNAELQFFRGVREELALELADEGYNVRIYVTYGNTVMFLLKGIPTFDKLRNLQRFLYFRKIF